MAKNKQRARQIIENRRQQVEKLGQFNVTITIAFIDEEEVEKYDCHSWASNPQGTALALDVDQSTLIIIPYNRVKFFMVQPQEKKMVEV